MKLSSDIDSDESCVEYVLGAYKGV